jgi:mannose-6-phosphate isomerase-like protein (cupin superfamily)
MSLDLADCQTVRVIDTSKDCPDIPLVEGGGSAKVVTWPGNGAIHRTFHLLTLDSGSKTIELNHPHDSVYYVISGGGTVAEVASGDRTPLQEGSMVHIDAGDGYQFEAEAMRGMTLLGGPCPADLRLYASLSQS